MCPRLTFCLVLDRGARSLLFYEVDSVFTASLSAVTLVTVSDYFAVAGAQAPPVLALTILVDLELAHCIHLLQSLYL